MPRTHDLTSGISYVPCGFSTEENSATGPSCLQSHTAASAGRLCCYHRARVLYSSNDSTSCMLLSLLYRTCENAKATPPRTCSSISNLILKAGHPTINPNLTPGQIPPRPLTTNHHHRPFQLLHVPHPPHWTPARPDIPHHPQVLPCIQHRIHIPRRNAVHPDPMHSPLGR